MAWVEHADLRTQKEKVYQDYDIPDKFQRVLGIDDQHYHDGSAWQDVDENLVDDITDGYAVSCSKVRHIIRMGSTGTRRWIPRRDHPNEYVSFGRLQSWNGSTWVNVNLGTHTRAGKQTSWSTTNFDLTVTNNWHRIKIEAVLKTEAARRRLRWAASLTGLTWDNWTLVSNSDAAVVGTIDKPMAWDTNGSPDNPNVAITNTYSGGFVEFGGNLSQAVLPITIDPTFTDGYGGDVTTAKDTFIRDADRRNFGVATYLLQLSNQKALIQFDVSDIPSDATCDSATLYLYHYEQGSATDFTVTAYSIASGNAGWPEGTKNNADGVSGDSCWLYKNQATGTETAWAGSAGLSTVNTDYEAASLGTFNGHRTDPVGTQYTMALTAARVQGWFGTPNTNYGLLLKQDENSYAFCSAEHATTAYRPRLVVESTEAGGAVYEMSALLAAASATPDTARVNVLRSTSAILAGASVATDVTVLNVLRSMAAVQAAASVTPDDVTLNILRSMNAALVAQSATPDNAPFIVLRSMAALLDAVSVTPDDVNLTVGIIEITAILAAQSTTSDIATLTVLRSMAALLASQSATPDDALITVLRSMTAVLGAISATPDISNLAILRSMSATLAGISVTSDDTLLIVLRSMAALLGAESTTPDDVILSIAGIVEMAAILAAQSATSDTTALNVLRSMSAALVAQSATPDSATLTVLRSMAAVLAAVSSTSDDADLLVTVFMAAVLAAISLTPDDAQINILRQVSALSRAQSVTADDASLVVLRTMAASLYAQSATPDDVTLVIALIAGLIRVSFSSKQPGVSYTSKQPGVEYEE